MRAEQEIPTSRSNFVVEDFCKQVRFQDDCEISVKINSLKDIYTDKEVKMKF